MSKRESQGSHNGLVGKRDTERGWETCSSNVVKTLWWTEPSLFLPKTGQSHRFMKFPSILDQEGVCLIFS